MDQCTMETQFHMITIHPRMGFRSVQMNTATLRFTYSILCDIMLVNGMQIELF